MILFSDIPIGQQSNSICCEYRSTKLAEIDRFEKITSQESKTLPNNMRIKIDADHSQEENQCRFDLKKSAALDKFKRFLSNFEYFAHYIIYESKALKESLTTTTMEQKMGNYIEDLSMKFEDLKKDIKMELKQNSSGEDSSSNIDIADAGSSRKLKKLKSRKVRNSGKISLKSEGKSNKSLECDDVKMENPIREVVSLLSSDSTENEDKSIERRKTLEGRKERVVRKLMMSSENEDFDLNKENRPANIKSSTSSNGNSSGNQITVQEKAYHSDSSDLIDCTTTMISNIENTESVKQFFESEDDCKLDDDKKDEKFAISTPLFTAKKPEKFQWNDSAIDLTTNQFPASRDDLKMFDVDEDDLELIEIENNKQMQCSEDSGILEQKQEVLIIESDREESNLNSDSDEEMDSEVEEIIDLDRSVRKRRKKTDTAKFTQSDDDTLNELVDKYNRDESSSQYDYAMASTSSSAYPEQTRSNKRPRHLLRDCELVRDTRNARKLERRRVREVQERNNYLMNRFGSNNAGLLLDYDSKNNEKIFVDSNITAKLKQHQLEAVKFLYDNVYGNAADVRQVIVRFSQLN